MSVPFIKFPGGFKIIKTKVAFGNIFLFCQADLRRADYIAKQRAMDDALMALEVCFGLPLAYIYDNRTSFSYY